MFLFSSQANRGLCLVLQLKTDKAFYVLCKSMWPVCGILVVGFSGAELWKDQKTTRLVILSSDGVARP